MKISKPQQAQNRRHIIRIAVDLMTEHGYEACTMKQIARAAGIGDATIYKYFPSKEKLLMAYYELSIEISLQVTLETPDLPQFSLQERLQLLLDSFLELLLADREFVAISKTVISKSPLLMMRDQMPGQQALKQQVLHFLEEAEQNAEIAPCEFKGLISGLFADYLFAVIIYWLNDDSEEFSDTTQLVDLTLAILVLALRSGLINKLTELFGFLLRSQMSRFMQKGSGVLELLKLAKRGLHAGHTL